MNIWMTRLARGLNWGKAGAPGAAARATDDSSPSALNRFASANPPRPPPERQRNSRRLRGTAVPAGEGQGRWKGESFFTIQSTKENSFKLNSTRQKFARPN